jgi:MYXO-CTERM domain-containing protein
VLSPLLKLATRSPELARRYLRPRDLFPAASGTGIPVLIETVDRDETARALLFLGARVGRPLGRVLPATVPLESIAALPALPGVLRIGAKPPKRLLLDQSRPDVHADRVEAGDGLPRALDGSGVLLGLVDTGIDYAHGAFRRPEGQPRVLGIWDQAFATGEPPPGRSSGAYCGMDRIDAATCDSIDLVGHGTHVAATMGGSEALYRGMAPGADFLAVASLDFALLIESLDWLFDEAQALGRPMVINLSLGGHYGPHAGSDLESQAIASLLGPGRIIVAAAGNEGNDRIHLFARLNQQAGKTYLRMGEPGLLGNDLLITLWAEAKASLSLGAGVERQGAEAARSAMVALDGTGSQSALTDGPTPLGEVRIEPAGAPDPVTGKWQVDILITPASGTTLGNPDGYVWYLAFEGSGAFDAWIASADLGGIAGAFSDRSGPGVFPGDSKTTVGSPAIVPGVLSVASYATRAAWTDETGAAISHSETVPGDLSFFSSRGPSPDPARTGVKPEIAAPGEYIVSARSKNAAALEEGTGIDATHLAMRGTSMACPHVAGIAALLLQIDPAMDPERIRDIIIRSARADERTGTTFPDDGWGYGKIDAFEATALALGVGRCVSDDDCRGGFLCGEEGRCIEEGGCGCTPGKPSTLVPWALLGLLRFVAARRK